MKDTIAAAAKHPGVKRMQNITLKAIKKSPFFIIIKRKMEHIHTYIQGKNKKIQNVHCLYQMSKKNDAKRNPIKLKIRCEYLYQVHTQ